MKKWMLRNFWQLSTQHCCLLNLSLIIHSRPICSASQWFWYCMGFFCFCFWVYDLSSHLACVSELSKVRPYFLALSCCRVNFVLVTKMHLNVLNIKITSHCYLLNKCINWLDKDEFPFYKWISKDSKKKTIITGIHAYILKYLHLTCIKLLWIRSVNIIGHWHGKHSGITSKTWFGS